MSSMVLAATLDNEQIWYVLAPAEGELDGVVITNERIFFVPFWSYVTRNPEIQPIRGCLLLDGLWAKAQEGDWKKKFWTHEVPLTDDEIRSAAHLTAAVPSTRIPAGQIPTRIMK